MRKTLITMLTAISIVGCVSHHKQIGPEAILAQMRADTAWIRTQDSLAAIAIGPMIDRYHYGPDGKLHPGEAVL